MNEAQFAARTKEVLGEEAAVPEQWWWLSFADEPGFLGATIVQARGVLGATIIAKEHGINPGGEVMGFAIPEGVYIPEAMKYKLLTTRAEIESATKPGGGVVSLGELRDRGVEV